MGILDKTKSSSQKTDHECVCAHAEVVHLFLFSTLWTIARQFPLSMRFSRQEYWSGLPCPSPWNLPKPDIEPSFPALQADSLPSEPPGKLQRRQHERKARSVGRTRNQLLRLQHLAWWLTSCLVAFELEHWLFSALKLNWSIGSSWVLSTLSLWTVTTSSSLLGVLLANSPCRSRDLPASLVAQLVKNLPAV